MSCEAIIKIKQGKTKSIEWFIIVDKVRVTDLSGWTCKVQIRLNDDAQTVYLDRVVATTNQDGDAFLINITSAESNIPVSDKYIIAAQFENTAMGIKDEGDRRLEIEKSWVFDSV